MFRVECEWDVGQENIIFETDTDAWEWIGANEHLKEICLDNDGSIDDLYGEGFIELIKLELYKKKVS